jgi:hypothetical protein
MRQDFVQQALKALRPDTPNWYGWAKVDADGNKIPNDQRMCWEYVIVVQDGVTKPTKAEFDAKVAELQAAHDAKAYARSRAAEYPAIGDQLDALFHAGVFPADMAATIQAVKDKYKKP